MFMRAEKGLKSASLPRQPLFYDRGDHLLAWINLRLMELPYESAGEPMPEEERAALDAVEEIAERQSNKLTFKLKPGDILLTHNHVCMHKSVITSSCLGFGITSLEVAPRLSCPLKNVIFCGS